MISVITPVYQGERCILQTLQSVLKQTYPYFELIVVDDGSTDSTLHLLNKYVRDPRVKIFSQKNQGTATARNLGIQKAKGDYIAFLDADDLWLPEKLAHDMETIQKCGKPASIIYSWYYAIDEQNRLVNISYPYRLAGNIYNTSLLRDNLLIPSITTLHRSIIDKIGGFDTQIYHEDKPFFIKACKYFPAYPTEQRLVLYRQTQVGKCRAILQNYEVAFEKEKQIIDNLRPILSSQEMEAFQIRQFKSLYNRFLMYNFPQSAKQLFHDVNLSHSFSNKKDFLAFLSHYTGINFLYLSRLFVQAYMKYVLTPGWRKNHQAIFSNDILELLEYPSRYQSNQHAQTSKSRHVAP